MARNGPAPTAPAGTLTGMELPDQRLRADLLAAGYTDAELLRLRRTDTITSVRPGAYVPSGDSRLGNGSTRHALLVHATLPRLAPGAVVSHASAAVILGLPVWGVRLDRVHVTRPGSGGGRAHRPRPGA
jgi:hypothetical protein